MNFRLMNAQKKLRLMLLSSFALASCTFTTGTQAAEPCPWQREELLKPLRTFSADQYQEQQHTGVKALLFESVAFRGTPPRSSLTMVPRREYS